MAYVGARLSHVFSSESVSEGHPDKLCDRISDAILDAFLARDPEARVAAETMATTDFVAVAGEYRSRDPLTPEEIEETVRHVIRLTGYDSPGFSWRTAEVRVLMHGQSPDIAMGVDADADAGKSEGAGDQGLMFGFACDETESLTPAAHHYAHRLLLKLDSLRKGGDTRLGPDAKSQVTLRFERGRPVRAEKILISSQHAESVGQDELRALLLETMREVMPEGWLPSESCLLTNPTGRFVIGGPDGDTGLTGRKIIVDTYGGAAPHGGGAFSGKDPTKVDRSAAYAARYLAKNVVAAGLASRCLIQIAYAIGVSEPVSFYCDTFGSGRVDTEKLEHLLRGAMDLTPAGIRKHLGLNRPIYFPTASYGHFGRTPGADGSFSWEKTDLAETLRSELRAAV